MIADCAQVACTLYTLAKRIHDRAFTVKNLWFMARLNQILPNWLDLSGPSLGIVVGVAHFATTVVPLIYSILKGWFFWCPFLILS